LFLKRKRQKIKLNEARMELHMNRIIKKHKLETLQNASNQVLDFQTKLTEELGKKRLSEPIVVPDQTLKSNDDQTIEESFNSSGLVKGKDTANSFLSDDEVSSTKSTVAPATLLYQMDVNNDKQVVRDSFVPSGSKEKDIVNQLFSYDEKKAAYYYKEKQKNQLLSSKDDKERDNHYYEEKQTNQSLSSKGNVLPDVNDIERPTSLNLVPSNDSSQEINEDDCE
ncbi:8557_t:CDS:2, partial [Racocetra persica]